MKYRILLLILLTFSSCAILFPKVFVRKTANFLIEKRTFNTTLDYNTNTKYLLNSTQRNNFARPSDGYNEQLITFFSKKLLKNIQLKQKYSDINGKIIIPFSISYDLTKDEVSFLQKTTNLDYVILSKIVSINEINNPNNIQYKSLKYRSDVLAGSVVFLKIYDIKNDETFIEINCKSEVNDEEYNIETGQFEIDTRISTYKSEKKLEKKAFKKILRQLE